MNNNPVAKIKMLKGSQKCLVFGTVSLLTLIGVPFALMATASRENEPRVFFGFCLCISVLSVVGFPFAVATIVTSVKVRAYEKILWNAARPYRIVGAACAALGVISSFIVIVLIIFIIMNTNLVGG